MLLWGTRTEHGSWALVGWWTAFTAAASAWSKALLDNAARPSGAIVYKGIDGQGVLSPE